MQRNKVGIIIIFVLFGGLIFQDFMELLKRMKQVIVKFFIIFLVIESRIVVLIVIVFRVGIVKIVVIFFIIAYRLSPLQRNDRHRKHFI